MDEMGEQENIDDMIRETEIFVSYKIVAEELLRRMTYIIEIASEAVGEEQWGLFCGACSVMEEINGGLLEMTVTAGSLSTNVAQQIMDMDIEYWEQVAKSKAYENGYEISPGAKMVQQYAQRFLK